MAGLFGGIATSTRAIIARLNPVRFARREDGTVTAFALIIFVLMVGVSGIAVDIMRYETQRVQLQYTLDRSILAAASLTQPYDPEAVVRDYFAVSGIDGYRLDVRIEQALNYRRVHAYAEMDTPTIFMRLFGIRVMTAPAIGAAEESVPEIEISLVLDVSGSMRFNDSDGEPRINRLRNASRGFVTRLLEDDRDEVTTISVVPYAGNVNIGEDAFELIGGTRAYIEYEDADGNDVTALRDHPRSHCIEVSQAQFASTGVPTGNTFAQVPHFHNWPIDTNWMDWGWCPLQGDLSLATPVPDSSIQYFSADADHLDEFLQTMRLHDGTGTHIGLLWGAWLLDPDSNWLVDELADRGIVASGFADRPTDYADVESIKVIVLMTDGNITDQYRPRFNNRTLSPLEETEEDEIFLNHTEELAHQHNGNDCNGNGCRTQITSRNWNLSRFYEVCNRADAAGIVIFTIAFDANSAAQQEMRNCATSAAHYYNARGADLDTVFQSIAGAIQQLRLVQ